MSEAWWLVAVAALIAIALVLRPVRAALRERQFAQARKDFHRYRERLEAKFFQIAANSGKPRGLNWTGCDFDDDVVYVRDRRSGELSAFVAVTISFEAKVGGGMEDVEAVGNLRAATAVFHNQRGAWASDGKAIFNLNPTEALQYYHDNLVLVGHEVANPT